MLNYYMLRIDSHECFDVVKGIDTYSYVCEDDKEGNNPHTHFYIETTLKNDSLRKRIFKLPEYKAGKKGNSFYALRSMQPGENEEFPYLKYHAYMAKISKPGYVGFGRERLARLRAAVSEYKAKVKAGQAERRRNRKTILQQMELEFKFDQNPPDTVENIAISVIKFYESHEKLIRKFAMVSQVQTLALKYVPSYRSTLLNSIMRDVEPHAMREWYLEKDDLFNSVDMNHNGLKT